MRRPALLITILTLLSWPAMAEPIRVRLLVSNPRPYAGEPVRLTLEVERPLRGIGPLRPRWPKAPGTVLVDEPPARTVRLDNQRGLDLLYRVIRPLSPGPLTLDRAGVVAGTRVIPAGARTLFVAPLPKTGRPEDFTGLVGRLDAALSPADSEGKMALRLAGSADLKLAGIPVQCVDGRRPVAISDRLKGHWPGWTRTLTLLTDPECRPRLRLAWYDTEMDRYHATAEAPAGFRSLGAAAALLATALLLWAGREGYRLRTCRRWLNRNLAGLPRHRRLEWLTKSGVPGPLAARIDHHWQQQEAKAPRGPSSPAAKPGHGLPWTICRQLAATIDKRRWHRP